MFPETSWLFSGSAYQLKIKILGFGSDVFSAFILSFTYLPNNSFSITSYKIKVCIYFTMTVLLKNLGDSGIE